MASLSDTIRSLFGKDSCAADAAGVDPEGCEPRMSVKQIAATVGLPEERVAMMAQMIRQNGLSDAQMGPLLETAHGKGVSNPDIIAMLSSLGVSKSQVVRVMRAQGIMDDDEADRLLAEDRERQVACAAREKGARRRSLAKKAAIIAFWLVVWEAADRIVDNRLVLAGPLRTLEALGEQIAEPDFWLICGASFGRIAMGFLLSFAVGFLLALACYRMRIVRDFVDPVISLLRTIPVVSFIIMLLIWVGNQALTALLAFFIVLPLIYTNVMTGFENVDRHMLEMARVYRLSRWRTFLYIYRPAFMPFLISSSKISLGMTWKSGIMAEVLATPKPSIGKEMSTARTFLDTPDLFAWTVVVMILSVAFEKLFLAVLRRVDRPLGGLIGSEE